MSPYKNRCWRCHPQVCNCPPPESIIEELKGEVFLLDRELQRENRRAREFADALQALSKNILWAVQIRTSEGGLDNLPHDLFRLSQSANEYIELLAHDRNKDNVSALYKKLCIPRQRSPENG